MRRGTFSWPSSALRPSCWNRACWRWPPGAYTAQYNTPRTARIIFDMLTFNSARIFAPSEGYGLAVGNDADLNVIDAENVQEALRTRASRPYIVRKGKVVAYFERKSGLL